MLLKACLFLSFMASCFNNSMLRSAVISNTSLWKFRYLLLKTSKTTALPYWLLLSFVESHFNSFPSQIDSRIILYQKEKNVGTTLYELLCWNYPLQVAVFTFYFIFFTRGKCAVRWYIVITLQYGGILSSGYYLSSFIIIISNDIWSSLVFILFYQLIMKLMIK